MNEIARAYKTEAGNIVLISLANEIPIIGITIPNEAKHGLRFDLNRLKNDDIPLTSFKLTPEQSFKFYTEHEPDVILYDNDEIAGRGAGEPYYDA